MPIVKQDEHHELISMFSDSARDFIQARSLLDRIRQFRNTTPGYERDIWAAMAEAGWNGLLVSEEQGGLDLGLSAVAAIATEIGKSPLPEPYLAGAVQAAALLRALPESELANSLMQGIASGEYVMGVAWQGGPAASDDAQTPMQFQADGDAVTVSGTRQWVYPAHADGWLLVCRAQQAVYWLPADMNGLHGDVHFRLDGSAVATLTLDAVPLDRRSQLLAEGEIVADALQHAINVTRIAQSAELIGMAEATFESTLEYLKTRVQFGQAIGNNQALQHRM